MWAGLVALGVRLLPVLRGLPWKWIGLAVAVLALLGGVYGKGWHDGSSHEKRAQAARVAAARAKVVKIDARADQITADVGAKVETRQAEIRTVTRTIVERIPVYVTPETDARFPLPAGLVSVYNDSLAGRLPQVSDPAAVSYGEPSDVTASRAATVMASNNGACVADQERLASFQDWYKLEAANH